MGVARVVSSAGRAANPHYAHSNSLVCSLRLRSRTRSQDSTRTLFRTRILSPTDVVVRHSVALMDTCNRQLQCLIPGFLGFGKIALNAERAHFAIPVRDVGCRCIPSAFCGCYDRTNQATALLHVFRLHSASR